MKLRAAVTVCRQCTCKYATVTSYLVADFLLKGITIVFEWAVCDGSFSLGRCLINVYRSSVSIIMLLETRDIRKSFDQSIICLDLGLLLLRYCQNVSTVTMRLYTSVLSVSITMWFEAGDTRSIRLVNRPHSLC